MKYAMMIAVLAALAAGGFYLYDRQQSGEASGRAAGGPAGGFAGGSGQPALVAVAPVGREMLYDTASAIGTAQANESITLTAKVTDTVRAVHFEDGDYVEEGDVLVELTNEEQEALLAEARANLDDAERQLRRLEDLTERGLAPESDLDMARSNAEASEARLDTVLARLRDRVLQAPFSGLLGFRQVSPGTLVTSTTPITTLDDISTIKLDFTVPETFLGAMEPGARVVASSASYPNREFEGVVRTVGSRVDPVTRAIRVRAQIPNEERALLPGMLLTVRVVMAERMALVVPENAVYQRQSQAYVYRVGPDDRAHEHPIELGDRRFGLVEVREGLEEGDLIVTEGIVKLRDGAPVRYQDPASAEVSTSEASRLIETGAGGRPAGAAAGRG